MTKPISKNLKAGLDFLWPVRKIRGGYRYFDEASNKYWLVKESEIRKLGKKINQHLDDQDLFYSANQIYSFWCNESNAKEIL